MNNVFITGLGVAAPTGVGTEEFWAATLRGECAIKPITAFDAVSYPTRFAGEVDLAAAATIPGKFRAQTDHMTQLAMTATVEALQDAGLELKADSPYEIGVTVSNSSGGIMFGQRELEQLWSNGPNHVSAYMAVAWFYAATAGQLSIRHGLKGPALVMSAEQAGGLDAIGHARRQVRAGTPVMVTGGSDASISPGGLAFQAASGMLSTGSDPQRAFIPFDKDAAGYVPGNGGAILVLEDEHSARNRTAPHIYGRLAGYAATFDAVIQNQAQQRTAYDPPTGIRSSRLAHAACAAIQDAGLTPGDIDVVFADASGLPQLDTEESSALTALFGTAGVSVTAPKTMFGRLYSGGAPIDLVMAILAIRDQVVPPTVNTTNVADHHGIDLVLESPRQQNVRNVLVLARGAGGFNSAIVITRS